MTCTNPVLTSLTVNDFKDLFFRDFLYLPVWSNTTTYKTDDVVFYSANELFYKSLVDNNTGNQPDTSPTEWELTTDSKFNYVLDEDITKAYSEACSSINEALYGSDDELVQAYLYLAAHYLVQDITTSQSGLSNTGTYPVNSRSVGSVSESYTIPEAYTKSPILSYYTKTNYGLKYLNLTYPKTRGNVVGIVGQTNPR